MLFTVSVVTSNTVPIGSKLVSRQLHHLPVSPPHHFKTWPASTMAQIFSKPTSRSPLPAPGPSTYTRLTPTNVRATILTAPVSHCPTNPTRHPPRDFWQQPALCPQCKNYGPQGDICTTCTGPRYYYGNELSGKDILPLLAHLPS
jgi:hypothetical protein